MMYNNDWTNIKIDFDGSLGHDCLQRFLPAFTDRDRRIYKKVKTLYESSIPHTISGLFEEKIPKVIHHIWLGGKPLPDYFHTYLEEWKRLHPGWQFKLWTDKDLKMVDKDLLDCIELSHSYGEKSDIFRSFILYKWGGVYVDVDLQPVKSLEALHYKYSFYVGIENLHQIATSPHHLWLGISIIGSRPSNPLLYRWQRYIVEKWQDVNERFTNPLHRVLNHTYMGLTHVFEECLEEGLITDSVVFPPTYFYPLSAKSASQRRSFYRKYREMMLEWLQRRGLIRHRFFTRPLPETVAIHHWNSSWIK